MKSLGFDLIKEQILKIKIEIEIDNKKMLQKSVVFEIWPSFLR